MKKALLIPAVATVLSGFVVSPVSAQDAPSYPSSTIKITVPASGSKVGNKFEVRGTIQSNQPDVKCAPSRLYVTTQSGYFGDGKSGYLVAPQLNGDIFSYQVDLTQPLRDFNNNPISPTAKAVAGELLLQVSATNCSWGDPESQILVEYTPDQQAPVISAPVKKPTVAVTAPPTSTPSPSPSVAPAKATPTAEVKADSKDVDPMAALILGALLGAAILALAEVSAVEYRKKHGPKGDMIKKTNKKK